MIPTKTVKQHWTESKFSYMTTPRPDYGLLFLINGHIDFITPEGEISATSGDMIFLPQDSFYEAHFRIDKGEIDDYLINFEADKNYFDCKTPVVLTKGTSLFCRDLFKNFVEESYDEQPSLFRKKGLFYLLIDRILSEKDTLHNQNNDLILNAKELLESDTDYPLSYIAKECCVSESKLRKTFKASVGITPVQYRLNKKITKAKYLLESTDLSVGEISEKLNFFDAAYFTKTFARQVGMSPRQYSKNKKL